MKRLFPITALSATALTTLLVALLPLRPAAAQQLPPLSIQFDPSKIVNPGRPGGRRRGGGSRGECAAAGDLSAIAYADSETIRELDVTIEQETVGTLTTLAQPMLWFYLPVPLSDDTNTTFVVKSEQDTTLYEGQLAGETSRDGIVQVPLGVELTVGDRYEWSLTLDCDGEPTTVSGWIARHTPNPALNRPFAEASPRNRAALFANEGFLQDAIGELATLRRDTPEDQAITKDWADLLRALDLIDLAAAPMLDCCTTAESGPAEETAEGYESEESEPSEELEPLEESEAEAESLDETPDDEDTRTILQRARDKG